LLAVLAACQPYPPVVYPQAPTVYYSASYETNRQSVGGDTPRRSDILAKDAKQKLRPGVTVAFLPPDSCVTTSVAPSGASQGTTSIMMECGALLASLEAEVAKAGYSVVSWQAIKGGGSVASQERAKGLGIDVLFEVNELTPNRERALGAAQISNLSFARWGSQTKSTPLEVTPDVANRCGAQIMQLSQTDEKEYLSTVNLKAVDVAGGRALWLYQNTVVEAPTNDQRVQKTVYYAVQGQRPEPPPLKTNNMAGVAAGTIVLGSLAVVGFGVGALVTGSGLWMIPALLLGAPFVGLGIGLGVSGHRDTKPDYTVPEATYAPAGDIVCATDAIVDPWSQPSATSNAKPAAASSYSFSNQASAGRDLTRERIERLTRRTTEDFVAALRDVAGIK
jgi:hypothetical protein